MKKRYIVDKLEYSNQYDWIIKDTVFGVNLLWKEKSFNKNQKVELSEKFDEINNFKLPTILREIGDYLYENHKNKL